VTNDAKAAAVALWSADPCGPDATDALGLLAGRRKYAPWMAGALDYHAASGLEVLDVGCGQGIDLCEYALAGAKVTGIDLTPRHVELARVHLEELGLSGEVLNGDAENLPFADCTFDVASSNGVLHHTPDMGAALNEIHRVLRPDGRATVLVYNRNSIHYWFQQLLVHGILTGKLLRERSMANLLSATVERSSIGARPLVRTYTRGALRDLLCRAGFEDVTVNPSPLTRIETSVTKRLPSRFEAPLAKVPLGWYLVGQGRKRASA